jgi:hypothetical protein
MRKSFERSLEQYREVAKDFEEAKKPGTEPLNINAVEQELEFVFARNAKANKTDADTQSAVFDMQRYKQEIMTALREELRRIDAKEQREVGEGQRFVRMEGEEIVWDRSEGESVKMTLGELLTDGEWGVEYVLDVESVPRDIQKKYTIGETKRKLLSLLNEQIVLSETGRSDVDISKKVAYEGNLDLESKIPQGGFIAERGVGNFLKKLSIDLGVDIEVVDATVYHDVEQKVDFMVKIGSKNRGVEVGEHDQQYVGFQFTTNTQERVVRRKLKQIKKAKNKYLEAMDLDDILLVAVPIQYGRAIFRDWQAAGSPPGGPDSLWSNHVRELITRHILASVESQMDVDEVVSRLPKAKRVPRAPKPKSKSRRSRPVEKRIEKPQIQETVYGCKEYFLHPDLLHAFAELGESIGVDLQKEFQDKLDSLDGEITQKRMHKMLSKILRHNGLDKIEHHRPETIPASFQGLAKKLSRMKDDKQKHTDLLDAMFVPRSKK